MTGPSTVTSAAAADEPADTPAPSPRSGAWGEIGVGAATAGAALAIALVVLQVWRGSLDVPWRLGGDADFYRILVGATLSDGWHLTYPHLGAPYGQELYDLPHGLDNLQILLIKLIGLVTGNDPVVALNVYYLLTFPLIAISMYACLRILGVQRLTSVVIGVLYAVMPYHFIRGSNHLFLSGYYMVPIAVLLIVLALGENPPFARDEASWRPWFDRRGALVLLACIGIASTGAYYAVFTVVLLAVLAVAAFLGRRDRRILVSGATIVVAIGIMMIVNLAPTFVYWALNGTNETVAQRTPQETELNGLRISELVIPRQNHRIAPLRTFDQEIDSFRNRSENGMPLGAIGAVGFLGLLGGAVVLTLTRIGKPPADPVQAARLRHLSGLVLVSCLIATIGGFSLILSALGLREIRAWNRISIVIGAAALIAVALVWDRYVARRVATPIAIVLIVGLGIVGVLDQTGVDDEPPYEANALTWSNEQAFVRAIEAEVEPGSMIFQVPYVPFPESKAIAGAGPYDASRFALMSDDLRWSYGAMQGRQGGWQDDTAGLRGEAQVAALRERGFAGIVVDRIAFTDPAEPEARVAELVAATGNPAIDSPEGRYAFVPL